MLNLFNLFNLFSMGSFLGMVSRFYGYAKGFFTSGSIFSKVASVGVGSSKVLTIFKIISFFILLSGFFYVYYYILGLKSDIELQKEKIRVIKVANKNISSNNLILRNEIKYQEKQMEMQINYYKNELKREKEKTHQIIKKKKELSKTLNSINLIRNTLILENKKTKENLGFEDFINSIKNTLKE